MKLKVRIWSDEIDGNYRYFPFKESVIQMLFINYEGKRDIYGFLEDLDLLPFNIKFKFNGINLLIDSDILDNPECIKSINELVSDLDISLHIIDNFRKLENNNINLHSYFHSIDLINGKPIDLNRKFNYIKISRYDLLSLIDSEGIYEFENEGITFICKIFDIGYSDKEDSIFINRMFIGIPFCMNINPSLLKILRNQISTFYIVHSLFGNIKLSNP